jgi:RNA exonuclease 1
MKKMRTEKAPGEVISDDDYKQLKKELTARRNALKNNPSLRLKYFGDKASLSLNPNKREPLMFDDIQFLLMTALLGNNSPFKPARWCTFEKVGKLSHTVVLVVEGITSYCFSSNESAFIKTKGIFTDQLEVVMPKYGKNGIVEELSAVPLTQSFKEKLIQKYGSLEVAINQNKDHHLIAQSVFPIEGESECSREIFEDETFARTRLLLSPLQMMIEGYPMPLEGEFAERYRTYRFSRDSYKPVHTKSPMYGLDCEMCLTSKNENELARVSIVDEEYNSVYETLVRPTNKITDYLTPWSGITKEMMENVTKTLKDVQEDVRSILPPDAILVAQLRFDSHENDASLRDRHQRDFQYDRRS